MAKFYISLDPFWWLFVVPDLLEKNKNASEDNELHHFQWSETFLVQTFNVTWLKYIKFMPSAWFSLDFYGTTLK